ncbi:MAG: hypothetical protein KGK08_06890 [Acidobacteriota bacterium]|nr:hypothetical protein [Acidobacteriota bacterium]
MQTMDAAISSPLSRKDTGVRATCLSCQRDYPTSITTCPHCELPTAIVQTCSQCHQVISARHPRCPFCGFAFYDEPAPPTEEPLLPVPEPDLIRLARRQRLRVFLVTSAVFVSVAVTAFLFNNQRPSASPARALANTQSLAVSPLYADAALTLATSQQVKPGSPLSIISLAVRAGGAAVLQVALPNGAQGYLPSTAVAPPKSILSVQALPLLQLYAQQASSQDDLEALAPAVRDLPAEIQTSPEGIRLESLMAERLDGAAAHQPLPADLQELDRQLQSRLASHGTAAH